MLKKPNVIFLASATILLLMGFLIHDPFSLLERKYEDADRFFELENIDQLKSIKVMQGKDIDKKFTKENDIWVLSFHKGEEAFRYNADKKALDDRLKKLFQIRKFNEVTSDSARYEEYKVSDNDMSLEMETEGGKKYVVYIGKSAETHNTTMVRLVPEKEVYSVKGALRDEWRSEADAYRDKKAFNINVNDIQQVIFTGKNRYRLEKNEKGVWHVNWGAIVSDAKSDRIKAILDGLRKLEGSSFYDGTPGKLESKIAVMLANDQEVEVEIFNIKDNELVFRSTENPYWMKIPRYQIDPILVPYEEIKLEGKKETP